ncbi:glycosyltransferase family 4 protein [Sporolactobacillus vineae]|uniref:glycosyltransferase family 4 protein n=1 Tax=Sporolactobacillus vineae TaxID=444463 RepID=UPI0002889A75|nr:glycosyltransferase family 4 protein [Sporolactobacillus vineae]
MKVAIVTAGTLPVPAVRGGAVETLVENLAKENEKYRRLELVIISVFDHEAEKQAHNYPHTRFIFLRPGLFLEALDKGAYFIANKLLKKSRAASYRNIFRRFYMLHRTARILARGTFDRVVLENSATLFQTLKKGKNDKKYEGNYYYHIHNVVTGSYGCAHIISGCKTLAVSNYINHTLPDFMQTIPKQNRRVVYNGIDTERFNRAISKKDREQRRHKFGLEATDIVLIFVGRLTPEKGIKELLQAYRKIDAPNVKLLIVGSHFFDSDLWSPFEEEIRQMCENMKNRVIVTGFIPYKEMPFIYSIADIAVLPSIWEEPAGLTMIEAMASGLPLITTLSGGIPEYVQGDGAVLLPRDEHIINNIAGALRELVMNHDLRLMMAKNSPLISQRMDLDRYYLNFINAISD